jgi:Protein of unknown function DUF115
MIAWTGHFPPHRKLLGYLRILLARLRFDQTLRPTWKVWRPGFEVAAGYCQKLEALRGRYAGQRAFVIGAGPSLNRMDLSPLRDEVTIASNGVYRLFPRLGYKTTFLLIEDIAVMEARGREFERVRGTTKIAALHDAHAFRADDETLFMNVRFGDSGYWDRGPAFSFDFPHIVYLGATITYIGLQLACHLGCQPIYLIGVDHNYGNLTELLPPGKVKVTADNIRLLTEGRHFVADYHKIGDLVGVPYLDIQNRSYQHARRVLAAHGVAVYNAGIDSLLEVFEKVDYQSLFGPRPTADDLRSS